MNFQFVIRPIIGLFAALFLWLQVSSISHATAYADLPHEHDGAVCVLATLATEAIIIPLVQIDEPVIQHSVVPTIFTPNIPVFYSLQRGRAPPPRGPPATF